MSNLCSMSCYVVNASKHYFFKTLKQCEQSVFRSICLQTFQDVAATYLHATQSHATTEVHMRFFNTYTLYMLKWYCVPLHILQIHLIHIFDCSRDRYLTTPTKTGSHSLFGPLRSALPSHCDVYDRQCARTIECNNCTSVHMSP